MYFAFSLIKSTLFPIATEQENKSNILTFSIGLDRIDYMFVSNNIKVESYEVLIKNMSDHYPIVAKILI